VLGRDVLLSILASEGVRHIFGNPGTTELPLMDALAGPAGADFDYVLSLQEATVVGMADGYAQASGRPAFVNLHTSAGLGNAIGNLTNAAANGASLVVTAGNADRRHLAAEPLLSGDLVGLARGVVKWGYQVTSAAELGVILRRAFLSAASPDPGPVFVAIPSDVLDTEIDAGAAMAEGGLVPERSRVDTSAVAGRLPELADGLVGPEFDSIGPAPETADWSSVPPPEHPMASPRLVRRRIKQLASHLAKPDGPVSNPSERVPAGVALVAGEEVVAAGGVATLVELAEALGCPVYGSPLHSVAVFPTAHPLWAGPLPAQADRIRGLFESAQIDRALLVGSHAFMVYPWSPGAPVPENFALYQLTSSVDALGRTHPVRLGVVGNIRRSLEILVSLVRERVAPDVAAAAVAAARSSRAEAVVKEEAAALELYSALPMDPTACVHALLRALPPEITVVDEAITTGSAVRRLHRTARSGRYFFCRGGGLGWGMPAACGVSLARGGEPVLCIVGDGSAMYSPQALWTAASRQLPVLFAVVNNRQYAILKANLRRMGGVSAKSGRFIGMDIDQPGVDFCALATSMGVTAERVDKAADIGAVASAAWASGKPALIELPIAEP
jgi:benzoylformate decarboxylase